MLIAETLLATALSVGVIHTLIGVDHALPFIVLSRARGWSLRRTLGVTVLCGLAHVFSSVLIGAVGLGLGFAVSQLQWIESQRSTVAAWTLIGFGLAYAVWGIFRTGRHVELRETPTMSALVVIFVLGPCEALIPLLMVPASLKSPVLVAQVALVFGLATVGTMLVVVALGYYGLRARLFDAIEHHVHTVAGVTIALSGISIKVLGL